jgi:methyl-accepting chemotaxis protein
MAALPLVAAAKNLKLRSKILGLVGVLLAILCINAGITLWKLDVIGAEIADVAEIDVPLTGHVSEATVAQLDQSIMFERVLRLAPGAAADTHLREIMKQSLSQYEESNLRSEEELEAARHLAQKGIAAAHSKLQREELENVLSQLDLATKQHETFASHVVEIFAKVEGGDFSSAEEMVESVEQEQDRLNAVLRSLTAELESFTTAASEQAEADEKSAVNLLVIITAIGFAVGVGLGWVLANGLTGPLSRAVKTVRALAEGDTSVELRVDTKDEVGELAETIEVFRQTTIKANTLAQQQAAEEIRKKERLERQAELTKNFDRKIGTVLETVAAAAAEMQSTANSLRSTAERTTSQASAVAAASQEASTNVQTVAAAAEELSNAIAEISNQVNQSTAVAQGAGTQAEDTDREMKNLDETAQRIGEIIALISDIAEQTNLLALNATIEAARAGEYGKGFAVVASEVKSLANQTAKATEDITRQIGEMQSATTSAVGKINQVNTTISRINQISTGIASAVEEQTAATQEIARNVEQAAAGTAEVDKNIAGVSTAATETGSSSEDVLEAAGELSRQADTMKIEVQAFLDGIRELDEDQPEQSRAA